MSKNLSLLKPAALALLCLATSASQAAITVYTTQASYLAAVLNPATDTFSNVSLSGTTESGLTRTVGAYSYVSTSYNRRELRSDTFFGAGTAANPWLSSNDADDSMTFNAFTGGVKAVGGNFFGSDQFGNFLSGNITLTVTDSTNATLTQTITAATTSSFLGFISTGTISALVVTAPLGATPPVWPTVDNLTLAVTAVPEPQTYALLLAGLGLVGFVARRRR